MNDKINKLKKELFDKKTNIDAAVITSQVNRRYFSSFNSSDGFLVITREKSYLLLDFRYIEAASRQVNDIDVVLYNKLSETMADIFNEHNIKNVVFENELMTLKEADYFDTLLKAKGVNPIFNRDLDYIIENLRIIKTEDEILKIKRAQEITESALRNTLKIVKPGVKERDLALEIEFFMKKNSAEDIAFDLIVVSGKNSSLPHGVPSDKKLEYGDLITFDIGAVVDGYHSDMTRTVSLGKASDEHKKVYNTVLEAQKLAIDGVRAGVKCFTIDSLARNYIYNNGYKGCFGHSTGHGVGIMIHENPTVSSLSNTVLEPNMVITVEPGIYLKNKFGVRIEDMLIVKQNGYENITNFEKNLIEL